MLPLLHAVSPYGRWSWRSELCVSRARKKRDTMSQMFVLCCVRLSVFGVGGRGPARPRSARFVLNRLIRSGRSWKAAVENETRGDRRAIRLAVSVCLHKEREMEGDGACGWMWVGVCSLCQRCTHIIHHSYKVSDFQLCLSRLPASTPDWTNKPLTGMFWCFSLTVDLRFVQ